MSELEDLIDDTGPPHGITPQTEDANLVAALLCGKGVGGTPGIPFILWGPPGKGKTSLVQAVVDALGLPRQTIDLGTRPPEAALGMPWIDKESTSVRYRLIFELTQAYETEDSVVIFDDLTAAMKATTLNALRFLSERRIENYDFIPKGTRVLGIANPPNQGGAYDLNMAIANRFAHIHVEDGHLERYFSGEHGGIDGSAFDLGLVVNRSQIESAWREAYAEAVVQIAEFVREKRSKAFGGPVVPEAEEWHEFAFPSARTLDLTRSCYALQKITGLPLPRLLNACVGVGHATEILHWLDGHRLPSVQDVLEGKAPFRTMRPDMAMQAVKVTAMSVTKSDDVRRLLAVMQTASDKGPDVLVPGLRVMIGRVRRGELGNDVADLIQNFSERSLQELREAQFRAGHQRGGV